MVLLYVIWKNIFLNKLYKRVLVFEVDWNNHEKLQNVFASTDFLISKGSNGHCSFDLH